eukprot:1123615-Pyramimonas_sp.AAC.1
MPLGLIPTEGMAPFGDNRVKILRRARTPFSGLPRHESGRCVLTTLHGARAPVWGLLNREWT